MPFSDKTYDTLKWVAQDVLPALGTLCFAIATLWGLPYSEQIVGTITAVDAFIGFLLGLSSMKYNGDGTLVVDISNNAKPDYHLELNAHPENLQDKKTVTFKVSSPAHMKEK